MLLQNSVDFCYCWGTGRKDFLPKQNSTSGSINTLFKQRKNTVFNLFAVTTLPKLHQKSAATFGALIQRGGFWVQKYSCNAFSRLATLSVEVNDVIIYTVMMSDHYFITPTQILTKNLTAIQHSFNGCHSTNTLSSFACKFIRKSQPFHKNSI